jgi:hypothetical protein
MLAPVLCEGTFCTGMIGVERLGNHPEVINGIVVHLGGLPLQYRQLTP